MEIQRRDDSRSPFPKFRIGVRGFIFIGLWVVGILIAGLFDGIPVTEVDQRRYNDGMRKAELMRDYQLEEETFLARDALHHSKTWSWCVQILSVESFRGLSAVWFKTHSLPPFWLLESTFELTQVAGVR